MDLLSDKETSALLQTHDGVFGTDNHIDFIGYKSPKFYTSLTLSSVAKDREAMISWMAEYNGRSEPKLIWLFQWLNDPEINEIQVDAIRSAYSASSLKIGEAPGHLFKKMPDCDFSELIESDKRELSAIISMLRYFITFDWSFYFISLISGDILFYSDENFNIRSNNKNIIDEINKIFNR